MGEYDKMAKDLLIAHHKELAYIIKGMLEGDAYNPEIIDGGMIDKLLQARDCLTLARDKDE